MSYQNAPAQTRADGDDRDLVRAAKRDVEAFGKLYDRYYGEVSGYIYHRTLDRDLTEELTSNTFFAALRHLGQFRWRRIPFGAWLYRIATNEIRMHYRRSHRVKHVSFQSEADAATTSKIRSPDPSASDTVIAGETFRALHSAIRELNPAYQTIGQKVRTLVDQQVAAGTHQARWDGRDDRGRDVASGTYLVRMEASRFRQTRKVSLVR